MKMENWKGNLSYTQHTDDIDGLILYGNRTVICNDDFTLMKNLGGAEAVIVGNRPLESSLKHCRSHSSNKHEGDGGMLVY